MRSVVCFARLATFSVDDGRRTDANRAYRSLALLESSDLKDHERGTNANILLTEVQRGFPVANLRRLLDHDKDAVCSLAWILSELGEGAIPLLGDVRVLLRHPARKARFFAIDVVLSCVSQNEFGLTSQAIDLITDEDSAVRWKVLRLLLLANTEQLRNSIMRLPPSRGNLIAWLLDNEADPRIGIISDKLEAGRKEDRLFAVVAAARWYPRDEQALRNALSSDESDVVRFASSELRLRRSHTYLEGP